MYRVICYYLFALLAAATIFGAFGLIRYHPLSIIASAIIITLVCVIFNRVFAWAFNAQTNYESVYITALILVCLISPIQSAMDWSYYSITIWAAVWAMASKYIFAISKKHIFNPAAFAVVVTQMALGQSASWWIGTTVMIPFIILGGVLLTKKMIRADLVAGFIITAILVTTIFQLDNPGMLPTALKNILLNSPLFFLAFVMLTEPLTMPATRMYRVIYGSLVGLLFVPSVHIGTFYFAPELALVIGNIISYAVSPKTKLMLKLKQKNLVATDTYDFIFTPDQPLKFQPGQYLEWTLGHKHPDNRGNRRYFTIASSPTEPNIIMGVKFYKPTSSFKTTLSTMQPGDTIIASQLSGEFVMPKDPAQPLVFIAGGIGITPFRSMIQYLLDKNEKRPIVLIYSARTTGDIAYKKIFDEAEKKLGIKTIYVLSDLSSVPKSWAGERGYVNMDIIKKVVPNLTDCVFYLSGPRSLVLTFQKTLAETDIKKSRIKQDFFPGFA